MAGVGRYPGIFGSVDAHIFRPERWLEATPEAFEEMQAAVDLVFSAGKYVCLGKQIAWMELLKFFVEVCTVYLYFVQRLLCFFFFPFFSQVSLPAAALSVYCAQLI